MLKIPDQSFNIATYNVHSCIGTDRRFSPDRIAEVIDSLDADVIGLQEVGWHLRGRRDFDQFEFLQDNTGYDVHAGVTKNHSKAHFGNAILTKWPVRDVRQLDLSVPFRARRGAIDVDVEIRGKPVRVINAHLGLDPRERQIQFSKICQAVEQHNNGPMLLMGDFNEWRMKIPPLRQVEQFFPNALAPKTFHTRKPLLRFDRIYASDDLHLGEHAVVRTDLTKRASDHLPVRCTVLHLPQ